MDTDSPRKYSVFITAEASLDLEAIGDYIAAESPENAARFIARIRVAITKLALWPRRFAKAREASDFPLRDLRQTVLSSYRIIFEIEGDSVHILHIRHVSRNPFTQDD